MARFRIETRRVRIGRRSGPAGMQRQSWKFKTAALGGFGAIVALGVGSALGNIHGPTLKEKLVALIAAVAFLGFSIVAIQSVAGILAGVVSLRAGRSGGTAVRVITSFIGYVIVIFVGLGMLAVPVQHLLLGGALTGVIVGIAAQQALGNVFAGLVLLLARPFTLDERVRVRSGALNGPFEGVVRSMTLAYVTIETDEGPVNVPNSQMLAAAVGPSPSEQTTDLAVARRGAPPVEVPATEDREKRSATKTVLARATRGAVAPRHQQQHHPSREHDQRR